MYKLLRYEIHLTKYYGLNSFCKHRYSQLLPFNQVKCEKWQSHMCLIKNYIKNSRPKHNFSVSTSFGESIATQSEFENVNEPNQMGKMYVESESMFYHQHLKDSEPYSSTIFKCDPNYQETYMINEKEYKEFIGIEDWDCKSSYQVAVAFISLGIYSSSKLNITMDDERFNKLINAFVCKSSGFTDGQLIDCLIAIQFWPMSEHVKTNNFLRVWKALDDICFKRYLDWTVDKTLFMMDLWFQIRLTRLSFFVFKAINRISRKCDDLTRTQMMQSLFYMSCMRRIHPAISLREYEHYIQKYITNLTIEEIGILSLAFFKTKTKILNTKIILYIMQRVVEEIENIPQMTITSVAKILRYSHKAEIGFTANDLVKKVIEHRSESLNLMNTIHLLHITTQIMFYNEEAITKLAEKFCNDPSQARLKELERVAFILSLYNFIPPSTPDILNIIMEQLDHPNHVSAAEIHPLSMLSLLYFLSLLRAFPEKQIRQVVNEEWLNKHYNNKYMTPVQAVQVDYNRVLEGPEGSEHLLSPKLRESVARTNSLYFPDKKFKFKDQFCIMMKEVMDLTQDLLGGEEYSLPAYTLPHYPRGDILFHLDEHRNPLPIPKEMREKKSFTDVVRPPGDEKGWFCVLVGGRNMYMHNVPRLLGDQETKLRQIKLLGYTPIVIPSYYWNSEKNKKSYLELKYFSRT